MTDQTTTALPPAPPEARVAAEGAAAARGFIRHVVFFSASDAADMDRIVAGLEILGGIPHSTRFEISRNTRHDRLSGEVDVVVYAEFPDEAALAAYKAHPLYHESIALVRPLREMRIAADF